MIGKKIVNSNPTSSKEYRIFNLADYIRSPQNSHSLEKCTFFGANGFLSDDPIAQAAEMAALANAAVKSKDPINHYVLSWRQGESPSQRQVVEAVDIFLDVMGVRNHQLIYGLHEDTDNIHLHLMLNCVCPITEKVMKINKGFDIEALHQAVAAIEYAQGWGKEAGSRYVVQDDVVSSPKLIKRAISDRKSVKTKIIDKENRTGVKSAYSIAIERSIPIFKSARSWEELHLRLAEVGMRYQKSGSGAKLLVGETAVKPSSVYKLASIASLSKKLGDFQEAPSNLTVCQLGLEVVDDKIPGVLEYASLSVQIRERKAQEREALFEEQRNQFKRLVLMQKEERERSLGSQSWKGRGAELNSFRSKLAAKHKSEIDSLKKLHKEQRDTWKKGALNLPNSCEQWLLSKYGRDVAHQYRHRFLVIGFAGPVGAVEFAAMQQHPELVFELHNQFVYYKLKGHQDKVGADLIDQGEEIKFCSLDERVVLAGLQMSGEKWGSFVVWGSPEFLGMCARLAAEHGLSITNPELQEAIKAHRESLCNQLPPSADHALRSVDWSR